MSDLSTNNLDRLTSVAKGVIGICPIIGPIASEAIGTIIPNQRLDRVVNFLRILENIVTELDSRMERIEGNLKSEEGVDIFEEGMMQAARSVSSERQERLANLVARSLLDKELKYAESRKILNIYRELTDQEILWLIFYSVPQRMPSQFHSDMIEKYPEVLAPASRLMNAPQNEIDRGALQDSYKNTLLRLGLIQTRDSTTSFEISALGLILVKYIEKNFDNKEGS